MQSAISVLYRTLVFNVNFKGFRIPTQAGFPDNYVLDKQFEFTYGNTDRLKATFDIELQSYLPIPDAAQEMFAGKNIQYPQANVDVVPDANPTGASAPNFMFPAPDINGGDNGTNIGDKHSGDQPEGDPFNPGYWR